MDIRGLNKLTLLDYPQKIAATIFLGGCNFCCPYCHNPALIARSCNDTNISLEEVICFLYKRRHLLDGVCISGGEALLQNDLVDLLSEIKNLGLDIKLDTNGSQPKHLEKLIDLRLINMIAIDIKNDREHYAETIGLANFDVSLVEDSLILIKESKLPYECRTTVVKNFHDITKLCQIAKWIAPVQKYYIQAFRDTGSLLTYGLEGYKSDELAEFLDRIKEIIPNSELR